MVEEDSTRSEEGSGEGSWAATLLDPEWFAVLSSVKAIAEKTGVRVFLVGGIVRQAVFSVMRPELVAARKGLLDIDFAIEGDLDRFIHEVQRTLSPTKVSRSTFLTVVCELHGGLSVDFAQCRAETYGYPGSLPEVTPASLEVDALRRDFSINAIYLGLEELFRPPPADVQQLMPRIIDFVGGFKALSEGIVEVLHHRSIFDDPTRIFRAVRYRAVLSAFLFEGKFGHQFLSSLKTDSFLTDFSPLTAVSHFRKWVELKKCFESGYPVESLGDLIELNILKHWPPVPSDCRSEFLEKIRKILGVDPASLSERGFLIFVTIWWWTNMDANLEHANDRSGSVEWQEQFIRARNELRLNKGIKRAITEQRLENPENILWLKEAATIYFGEAK